jgi:23S rRNA (guanine745-N1)-methyltransferase
MIETFRDGSEDAKPQLLPEMNRAGVRFDDSVELHRGVSIGARDGEDVLPQRASNPEPAGVTGNHETRRRHVRSSARFVRADVSCSHYSPLIDRNDAATRCRLNPDIVCLLLAPVGVVRVRLARFDDGAVDPIYLGPVGLSECANFHERTLPRTVAATMTMPSALETALRVLACPHCGGEKSLRCESGHVFDIARQGYASLTVGGGPHHTGDTAEMVAARSVFLGHGHYDPIAAAIAAAAPREGWCGELAGGTGYYITRVLDEAPGMNGVTLDVSKPAARAAARASARLASISADARAVLPFRSGAIDLVLSVFGPRRGDEVARILAPGGRVIVVTPRARHLRELHERFSLLEIGTDKEERLRSAMAPLELVESSELEYVIDLTPDDVVNAIMMGPNAFHRTRFEIEALAAQSPSRQQTTVAVTISTFRGETI